MSSRRPGTVARRWPPPLPSEFGTIAQGLGHLVQSASAQLIFSGAAAQRLGGLVQSASGALKFSGSAAQRLGALRQSVSAGQFKANVPATSLILDLDPAHGITQSGGTVSQWVDNSGNSVTFTQATSNLQPTFNSSDSNFAGLPSLTFASSPNKQGMVSGTVSWSQPHTFYVVAKIAGFSSKLVGQASAGGNIQMTNATTMRLFATTIVTATITNGGVSSVFGANFNGSSSSAYKSAVTAVASSLNPGSNGITALSVGNDANNNPLNGSIARVVGYGGTLSAGDHQYVMQGLGALYGITIGA